MKKGFTLLELLIVIGILAILATTVTVVLNPAELLKQARDSQRLKDLQSLDKAINLYTAMSTVNPLFNGTSTQGQGTCTAGAASVFTGACAVSTSTNVDGTGWITVDFNLLSTGSPLSRLPLDPVNSADYFYAFRAVKNVWEIDGILESDKYANQQQLMKNDGGDNDYFYEIGSSLTLGCPNSVKDADGNTYNTVIINNQCWMKENLRTGTRIDGLSEQANNGITEKYCYNNLDANCLTYGGLYQWNEAMNYSTTEGSQGICPVGWHIPKDTDQHALDYYLATGSCDGNRNGAFDCAPAGDTSKAVGLCGGRIPCGTSGFDALLAGLRLISGLFIQLNANTYFWSSSQYDSSYSWFRFTGSTYATVYRGVADKPAGLSVRCLKD